MKSIKRFAFILLTLLSISIVADEQQSYFYEYDEAGNLVGIRLVQMSGAPIVDALNPASINRDSLTSLIATGQNLGAVQVTTTEPDLGVSGVELVSNTEIRFSLFTDTAPLGPATLVFTNLLGSDQQIVTISERLPIISVNPSPLIVTTGVTDSIGIQLDKPFDTDKTLRLSIGETTVAEIVGAVAGSLDIVLTAGDVSFDVAVSGLMAGTATLQISQIEDSLSNFATINVLDPVTIPGGPVLVKALPVGLRLDTFDGSEDRIFTAAIGLRLPRPNVEAGERLYSKPVGINLLE